MVDIAAISAEELASDASKKLVEDLGQYKGFVAKATKAAEKAVTEALKVTDKTDPVELKALAETTFRDNLKLHGSDMLAREGHLGYTAINMKNSLGSVVEGGRQIVGKTKDAAGKVVNGKPGIVRKTLVLIPNWIAGFARNNPKTAFIGVTAGAVYAGSRVLAGREEAKNEANYAAQMQQVAAMQQAAAPQNPYYGGVSADEAAAMEAQMRSGSQQSSFVAAEQQRRAAAAAVEQPAKA